MAHGWFGSAQLACGASLRALSDLTCRYELLLMVIYSLFLFSGNLHYILALKQRSLLYFYGSSFGFPNHLWCDRKIVTVKHFLPANLYTCIPRANFSTPRTHKDN